MDARIEGHCGPLPARRKCGKDTDCPEPQECSGSGYCDGAAGQAQSPQRPQQGSSPEEVPAVFQSARRAILGAQGSSPLSQVATTSATIASRLPPARSTNVFGAIRSDPSQSSASSSSNYSGRQLRLLPVLRTRTSRARFARPRTGTRRARPTAIAAEPPASSAGEMIAGRNDGARCRCCLRGPERLDVVSENEHVEKWANCCVAVSVTPPLTIRPIKNPYKM
jgi:hypothetical protein